METNNNMKGFNIAEALKYAPKGLKLYSPIFGEVEFIEIDEDNCIVVRDKHDNLRWFYEYGTYFPSDESNYAEGECLLFPSIDNRCWNNWQNTLFLESIGSVCVHNITGDKFILGKDGTYFNDNTGGYYSVIVESDLGNYLLNSRYATSKEAKEFFEELDKNGYEWNGKTVVKKEQNKPKFKVGDIIKHKPTGQINTIKYVCSEGEYYILDNNNTLYFEAQDIWELVASKVKPTLEEKVNILADEIIALKQRVLALEIQVIKDMSTPPLTQVYSCPDKAGDNVTLEEMKG